MAEEHGIVINIEGRLYGVTVEEAWKLREYLPADASGLGASTAVRVRLEQLVYEADELELESPPSRLTKAEKQALYGALCSWLDDVTVDAFPPRMMALRYALYVEDVNDVEFRPVFLAYADGRREHREDVLVTGSEFEFEGRRWRPGYWTALHTPEGAKHGLVCQEAS